MYMMASDGGGSSSPASVTSKTTVNPGDIENFGKFLDEIASQLGNVVSDNGKLNGSVDFGEYDESKGAAQRYNQAAAQQQAFIAHVKQRTAAISTGALQLATRYTDLEELNAAGGSVVTEAIAEEA